MSFWARCSTTMSDPALVAAALRRLGHEAHMPGVIRGYHGSTVDADVVAKLPGIADVGFRVSQTERTMQAVADWTYVPGGEGAFLSAVHSAYAAEAVLAQAQRAGWKHVQVVSDGKGGYLVSGVPEGGGEIEATVDQASGDVVVEAKSIAGPTCEKHLAGITNKLAGEVVSRRRKKEFFEERAVVKRRGAR